VATQDGALVRRTAVRTSARIALDPFWAPWFNLLEWDANGWRSHMRQGWAIPRNQVCTDPLSLLAEPASYRAKAIMA